MLPLTCVYFKSLSIRVMGTEFLIPFYGHIGSAFLEHIDLKLQKGI